MNESNEVVSEVVNEVSEEIEQEIIENIDENLEEVSETFDDVTPLKKLKKHEEAKELVEKAKEIVKNADEQTEACKLLLVDDLKEYEAAKTSLKVGGLDACELLLTKLSEVEDDNDTNNEKVVVFETTEDVSPIILKNVSSGKFTGLILSLLGGAITAGGLSYVAAQKLGMNLNLMKVPSTENMEKILSWFSSLVGQDGNIYIGGAVLGGISLLVVAIIYAIRVGTKGTKNLHFAAQQYAEAELYTEQKGSCKAEMDKVDVHMKDTVNTLKMYEVLFNEQKGKLERILHIEGEKEDVSEYHDKSFAEINTTKELLHTIKSFITTPMSEEGKLAERSVLFLHRAKNKMNKVLEKLY